MGVSGWPLAATVAGASLVWAGGILAAPFFLMRGAHDNPAFRVAGIAYLLGSFLCHQDPARSFQAFGAQLPVCARCTGLYLAVPLGAAIGLVTTARPLERSRTLRFLLVASAAPTLLTWGAEVVLGVPVPMAIRAVAAAPLAAVVGWIVTAAAAGHLR
jgi:uncharacterized membrane protein